MSDMKLIMENWRDYQHKPSTLNENVTIEDFKKLVNGVIRLKKGVESGEITADVGGKILSVAIDTLTAGQAGNVKKIWDVVMSAKNLAPLVKSARLPDTETDNSPFLDVFNVSDEYSKILDDRIENAFINHLADQLEAGALDDIDIQTWDVNAYLEDWLKSKFDNKAVTGAPPSKIDTAKLKQTVDGLKKGGVFKAIKSLVGGALE